MKKLTKVIAVILAVITIASAPLSAYAAKSLYIKELKIAYGKTVEETKKKLTDSGYIAINGDLNKGSGGSVVMMGYKKTSDRNEAITDMRVMEMNGGFSYGEYDAMLEKMKTQVNTEVDGLMCAVEEFKKNYDAGKACALYAKDKLDSLVEDDSELGLGDYILQNADNKENLGKISLQGNKHAVLTMRYYLGVGCAENWLEDMGGSGSIDAIEVDERADTLINTLSTFQTEMQKYESILANIEATGQTEEEYIDSADDTTISEYISYGITYNYIKNTEVNGTLLYDILMKNIDDLDKPEVYPIVSALSAPLAAVLPYTGLNPLIYISLTEDEQWQSLYDESKDDTETEKISVYTGVDRSLFEEEGIALTTAALREQSSTGTNIFSDNTNKTVILSLIGLIGAGLIGTVSCVIVSSYFKRITAKTLEKITHRWIRRTTADGGLFIGRAMDFNKIVLTHYYKIATAIKAVECVCIGLMILALAAIVAYVIYKSDHTDYTTIPKIMIDETETDDGSKYTAYYVVKDLDGNAADMKNWSHRLWVAAYYTKDADAGDPITVNTLVQENQSTADGYSNLCKFGETAAFDLNSYSRNSTGAKLYMFFKRDTVATTTASAFSQGSVAVAGAAGLVIGSVITLIATKFTSKKKEKATAEA